MINIKIQGNLKRCIFQQLTRDIIAIQMQVQLKERGDDLVVKCLLFHMKVHFIIVGLHLLLSFVLFPA